MIIGIVAPNELPKYLACMDVYVCPSVRETFGISVVQAMAMRLAVVHMATAGLQVRAVRAVVVAAVVRRYSLHFMIDYV